MVQRFQPRSLRGVVRRHPEGGARRGVLRRRLVTAAPGGPGTLPARHLAAGSSLRGSGANAGERSAAPEPKTATVEQIPHLSGALWSFVDSYKALGYRS